MKKLLLSAVAGIFLAAGVSAGTPGAGKPVTWVSVMKTSADSGVTAKIIEASPNMLIRNSTAGKMTLDYAGCYFDAPGEKFPVKMKVRFSGSGKVNFAVQPLNGAGKPAWVCFDQVKINGKALNVRNQTTRHFIIPKSTIEVSDGDEAEFSVVLENPDAGRTAFLNAAVKRQMEKAAAAKQKKTPAAVSIISVLKLTPADTVSATIQQASNGLKILNSPYGTVTLARAVCNFTKDNESRDCELEVLVKGGGKIIFALQTVGPDKKVTWSVFDRVEVDGKMLSKRAEQTKRFYVVKNSVVNAKDGDLITFRVRLTNASAAEKARLDALVKRMQKTVNK